MNPEQVIIVSYSFGTLLVAHFFQYLSWTFSVRWTHWFAMAAPPASLENTIWNTVKSLSPMMAKLTKTTFWNPSSHPLYDTDPFISKRLPPSVQTLRFIRAILKSSDSKFRSIRQILDNGQACPKTTWIHGQYDTIFSAEDLCKFHQRLEMKDQDIVIVPNATHSLWSGLDDETSKFILNILKRVDGKYIK